MGQKCGNTHKPGGNGCAVFAGIVGFRRAQRRGETAEGAGNPRFVKQEKRPDQVAFSYENNPLRGFGSGGRDRTYDQLINSQLLYR